MSAAFWNGLREGINPAWSLAWLLYWLGHLVSLLMNRWEWAARLYPVYNWLMCRSLAVQQRFGFTSPWQEVKE